jgi:hypothetical protein
MDYDIIGDIHGHAEKLTMLLGVLGYRRSAGAWRHPDRRAIFVGDFIDRGTQGVETVRIVRDMVEAGARTRCDGQPRIECYRVAHPRCSLTR